ncbi:uncharacterized protein LOC122531284 [Frieseomelitta varia]|uniref:uncharacterized protein LOC122531284 n=1 Tax=Frieseomelitta varia TaxID=561572 RepID=UPI001CB6946E|nr:uncharacterized protein LOC122531284 [Frieseomelitta varia]
MASRRVSWSQYGHYVFTRTASIGILKGERLKSANIAEEARARISGPPDIYVKTGSLLTLTCLMSQGPHDLGTVAWFRGSKPVVTSPHSENDVNGEPRITVETEWSDALTSRLRITHAKLGDSGNYSCVPTVAERASVNVHVINGEHPAAMQHGNTAAGSPTSKTVLVMLAFFLGQLR